MRRNNPASEICTRRYGKFAAVLHDAQMANRLRQFRRKARLTQEAVAASLDISNTQLSRYETGHTPVTLDLLERLAELYGESPQSLIAEPRPVPVVGRVGAGAEIYGIDDHARGDGLYLVECPANLDARRTVALEVVGQSMFPIDEGWLVFYSRSHDGVPSECLYKLCVVKTADGRHLLKKVKPEPGGLFTLQSSNAPDLDHQRLDWAVPVTGFSGPLPKIDAD